MSSKPAVTAVVLALLSTSAFAQTAAPPKETAPPTQAAPPSKTPPAKTPPATQPAPPAQTPTPETGKPGQSPAPKPTSTTGRRPRAAAPQTQVVTRDVSGTPLEGVTLAISGAGRQEATTNASGIAALTLPDGQYRFRFAHEGFITLEKEVTIRNGRPGEVEVALNRAPPPPVAPPPPAPEPTPPPLRPSGPPAYVSIPAYLEKNFIGRDPLKESILGCMPDAMARLLQLRDPVAQHAHAEFDEVLYVVAGDGTVRIGTESIAMSPGMLTTIPRGINHAIERRGRNPLVLLSTLAGAGCPSASTTQAVTK
jgi:mannose-6-phosphate isomerase-like protein (cupin superfamily)